jgi:hypothetical protein
MNNMLKKIALTISLALAIVSASNAATIVSGADTSNGFSEENGADLGVGSLVRVGVFTLTDSQIQSAFATSNFAALNAGFIQLGTSRMGDGFGFSGHYTRAFDVDTTNTAGLQLALWVYKSSDNSSDTASIATPLQMGIFYMDRTVNNAWAVPPQVPVPGATVIDISNLTDASSSALRAGAHVVVGSFPKGTSDATGSPNFGLATVPEPSSIALLGVASLGLLARRRSK